MQNLSISKSGIQSVKRAMRIISLFKKSEELGITEMANALQLPKGTVHGLVKTLEMNDYLEQNPGNKKYRLGPEIFNIGLVISSRMDLKRMAAEYADVMFEELNESIHVAILLGGQCLIVYRRTPNRPFLLVPEVGSSFPAHITALGKVLLADISENQLNDIANDIGFEEYTTYTITDFEKLKESLAKIRKKGYDVSRQEALIGLTCVAAPIRDHTEQVIASIGVSASADSLKNKKRLSQVIEAVVEAAERTSASMGYKKV